MLLLLVACQPGSLEVQEVAEPPYNVSFVMNVHDFSFPERDIDVMNRLLDLHEARGVPLDVYLTDAMVQLYRAQAPALLDRLRDSPVVVVAWHVRPPNPSYPGFDWLGLDPMGDDERYDVLSEYETHATDGVTGLPTPDPGGYQLLADLMGYPPPAVGIGSLKESLSRIYAEKGATFGVSHDTTYNLGEKANALWLRPEHLSLQIYEETGQDPCAVLHDAVQATFVDGTPTETGNRGPFEGPLFINIKMHDGDFYNDGIGWKHIYYDDNDVPLPPPWDLAAFQDDVSVISVGAQAERWAIWEGVVDCVLAAPRLFRPVGLFDVKQMLEDAECKD